MDALAADIENAPYDSLNDATLSPSAACEGGALETVREIRSRIGGVEEAEPPGEAQPSFRAAGATTAVPGRDASGGRPRPTNDRGQEGAVRVPRARRPRPLGKGPRVPGAENQRD